MPKTAYATYEKDGKRLEIFYDEDPLDPLEDGDNLGIIAHVHRRYSFGKGSEQFHDSIKLQYKMKEIVADGGIALPVYLYDHSGLRVSTKPFACHWDSGQIGYIYATKERALKFLDEFDADKVTDILQGEIEMLDLAYSGQVYGFVVTQIGQEEMEDEEIDSCWGFYGDEGIKQILSENNFTDAKEI